MNGINGGVESVLGQLRALQARSQDLAPAQPADSGDFGATFKAALEQVNTQQKTAAEMSTGFVNGDPQVDLADAMLAINRADVSFKALAEVRNRLVSSYQDIMNMPI